MISDPIGDFLARIKNGITAGMTKVTMPSTNMLVKIAEIMKQEGFITDFQVEEKAPQNELTVELKYVNGQSAVRELVRKSKPGRRIYINYRDIKPVKSGFGVAILSTPMGVMTSSKARKLKVAGEYVCDVY